jgi:hypothetical protein
MIEWNEPPEPFHSLPLALSTPLKQSPAAAEAIWIAPADHGLRPELWDTSRFRSILPQRLDRINLRRSQRRQM